jgi:hypothetical protein
MRFIRRANKADFLENQTITIGSGGGSDDVTNIPKEADTAIEMQLEDGSTVVLLGYLRK